MEEKISGIVIGLKRYSEDAFLVSIITLDSMHKKGWLKQKSIKDNLHVGQFLDLNIYTSENQLSKFFILSKGNSLLQVFFNDLAKLNFISNILKDLLKLPQGIAFDGLYEKILYIIKQPLTTRESEWQKYYINLT